MVCTPKQVLVILLQRTPRMNHSVGGALDLMLCTPKQVLVIPSQRIPGIIYSLGINIDLKKRPSPLTKNARDDPLGAATRV